MKNFKSIEKPEDIPKVRHTVVQIFDKVTEYDSYESNGCGSYTLKIRHYCFVDVRDAQTYIKDLYALDMKRKDIAVFEVNPIQVVPEVSVRFESQKN